MKSHFKSKTGPKGKSIYGSDSWVYSLGVVYEGGGHAFPLGKKENIEKLVKITYAFI